jgi:hypothetical protein
MEIKFAEKELSADAELYSDKMVELSELQLILVGGGQGDISLG